MIRLRLRVASACLLPALLALGPSVGAASADHLELSGAYTLTGQTADDSRAEEAVTTSLDLRLDWRRRAHRLELYVEGNGSLQDDGVAAVVPESNADAGTAIDADLSGRLQLSELKYVRRGSGATTLAAGLLDPTVYLDSTRIDNDENLQFLGAPFVNNPTIEFPDYTFGVAALLDEDGRRRSWNLVLAASNGIADNPDRSYAQLIDLTEEGKGVFVGAEAGWLASRYLIRAGAWVNTASHPTLRGDTDDAANYGLYTAIGASRGRLAGNLRLGLANPDVSLAAGFASVGLQWTWDKRVLGVAAAHTWLSSDARSAQTDDSLQIETYLSFRLGRELYLSPSIQYLANSGFEASSSVVDAHVMVYGLRLHHVFVRHQRGG